MSSSSFLSSTSSAAASGLSELLLVVRALVPWIVPSEKLSWKLNAIWFYLRAVFLVAVLFVA